MKDKLLRIAIETIGDDTPASHVTPSEAAAEFARTYWSEPRKVDRHWLPDTGTGLVQCSSGALVPACEFAIVGETAFYRATWQPAESRTDLPETDDGHTTGRYIIERLGQGGDA